MPIQKTKSSVETTELEPAIVIFVESCCKPKVKGGPIKRIEVKAVSVQTNISLLVSMAVINSDPAPNRKSPAVFVAAGYQSIGFS